MRIHPQTLSIARRIARPRGDAGVSLIEILISAFLLIIVFFALADTYRRGHVQLGYEEDRRKATAVAQARIDGIRDLFTYDELTALADTNYVVEGRTYHVSHQIQSAVPEPNATTLRVDVSWTERVAGADVTRSLQATTILARALSYGGGAMRAAAAGGGGGEEGGGDGDDGGEETDDGGKGGKGGGGGGKK